MHQAWHVEEIWCLICERLETKDLARLAQTSRQFFDITTNRLWDTLDSVVPFLCCLPPDFTDRPLELKDIARLDFYARKVRKVVLESENATQVRRLPPPFKDTRSKKKYEGRSWQELWSNIAELRPTCEFLPNLTSIRVDNITDELLLPFVGITGSRLTSVYLESTHETKDEKFVYRFLSQIQDLSKLEKLRAKEHEFAAIPPESISRAPLKYLRLDTRSLLSGSRVKPVLQTRPEILQKSTLESLTLSLTHAWYGPDLEAADGKFLPNLKILWLRLHAFSPEERPPTLFFERLDRPRLELLFIKFPYAVRGGMLTDMVRSVSRHCRLENLGELVLAGTAKEGWSSRGGMDPSHIGYRDARRAMSLLLPLPKLRVLRITVAPNFLETLDLDFYGLMAAGLPSLCTLTLGHRDYLSRDVYLGPQNQLVPGERISMTNLAAFCCMFPDLVDVEAGCVDVSLLDRHPRPRWTCPNVKTLRVQCWIGRELLDDSVDCHDLIVANLQAHFPNSDMAADVSRSYRVWGWKNGELCLATNRV